MENKVDLIKFFSFGTTTQRWIACNRVNVHADFRIYLVLIRMFLQHKNIDKENTFFFLQWTFSGPEIIIKNIAKTSLIKRTTEQPFSNPSVIAVHSPLQTPHLFSCLLAAEMNQYYLGKPFQRHKHFLCRGSGSELEYVVLS